MNATSTSDPDAGPSSAAPAADDDPSHEPGASAGAQAGAQAGADPVSPAISVLTQTEDADAPLAAWMETHLRKAADLAGAPDARLTLVIVDDPAIIELHRQYHQLDTTTDVLTFDLREDPAGPTEGDIVICFDEARRQADQRGHAVCAELLLYAVHGLMHLLGEDDHDPDAYRRMHRREDDLLEALGLGRLFGGPPEAGAVGGEQ